MSRYASRTSFTSESARVVGAAGRARRSQEAAERRERARQMEARGMSLEAIAQVLGVHIDSVRRYRRHV
jgi:DNA-binding CsgD family transcriptional regulator